MSDSKTYSEAEAERFFAVKFHGMTWDMLDKPDRSMDDSEKMIDYAHSSLAHWRKAGREINLQRGYWLLSRVYSVLHMAEPALKYAKQCRQVTSDFPDQMEDFDLAFSYEALARAYAASGNKDEFQKNFDLAEETGNSIMKKEDREYFGKDLHAGDWFGFM
ncbi:MAG TPA: hypothetical protein VJZ78_04880 [Anaerolineales bacterium]|nr:hypothetical protein [Anaerolineales bacterium]